ncbi:hypothetical protein C8T65DRAFT_642184 [Cerioporus squamosus]|nr:hypothetical protein C8T65DRAFT_642184 [Cerioporus squamosus]
MPPFTRSSCQSLRARAGHHLAPAPAPTVERAPTGPHQQRDRLVDRSRTQREARSPGRLQPLAGLESRHATVTLPDSPAASPFPRRRVGVSSRPPGQSHPAPARGLSSASSCTLRFRSRRPHATRRRRAWPSASPAAPPPLELVDCRARGPNARLVALPMPLPQPLHTSPLPGVSGRWQSEMDDDLLEMVGPERGWGRTSWDRARRAP